MNPIEHLLSCLGEEGSEISQDCSKSNRFGLDDINILKPYGPTNRQRLVNELNDLMGVIDLCVENGILPGKWMDPLKIEQKKRKVLRYMEYAESKGALARNGSVTRVAPLKEQVLKIRDVVCDQCGITHSNIMRKEKTESIVIARWIVFFLADKITNSTRISISSIFKLDHSTVLHGIKSLQDRMDTNPKFKDRVENIEKICRKSLATIGR